MMDNDIDIRLKIHKAQAEIIDKLAICETLLSQLYSTYSEAMPELKEFWTQLAREEECHAKLLTTLHSILDRGQIFYNLDRLKGQIITDYTDRIISAIDTASHHPITPITAIETAIALESALIETQFYDTVTSDAPEFALIAKQLSAASQKHIDRIRSQHTQILQAQPPLHRDRQPPTHSRRSSSRNEKW